MPEFAHQNKATIPPELADIINHKIKGNWKLIDLFEYLNPKSPIPHRKVESNDLLTPQLVPASPTSASASAIPKEEGKK